MSFKQAERTQLYLRCALFGPSGSGKTMTALRMAKGIASKMNLPFAVIDTEARSASKYSDRIPFDVDNLERKTVDHYIDSMKEAAKSGYKVLVIDSLSHAWRELTDEVDRLAEKSTSKNTFSPWAKVNPKQKRFIDAILNYPGHIIATMRSSTEWIIGENKNGKSIPEKIGLKPEQGKGIEFEFDLLIEMNQKHEATITKDRTGKFQDEVIDKPGEDFGGVLYSWLSEGTKPSEIPVQNHIVSNQKVKENPAPTGGKTENKATKEQLSQVVKEIGDLITTVKDGRSCFSEEEKEQARQIIKTTSQDETGAQELRDFKSFIADELSKRQVKNVKAA